MGVGGVLVVQRKVAELRVAPHLDHLGCESELFAHICALDDDQFTWRALGRGSQTLGDSLEHACGARDYFAGHFAARADEQDQQHQHAYRHCGQDDEQPPVGAEPLEYLFQKTGRR